MKQSKRILSLALTLLLALSLMVPAFAEGGEFTPVFKRTYVRLHLTADVRNTQADSPATQITGTLYNVTETYDVARGEYVPIDWNNPPESVVFVVDHTFSNEHDCAIFVFPDFLFNDRPYINLGYKRGGWEAMDGTRYSDGCLFIYLSQAGGFIDLEPVITEVRYATTGDYTSPSFFEKLWNRIQEFFAWIISIFSFAWLTGRA